MCDRDPGGTVLSNKVSNGAGEDCRNRHGASQDRSSSIKANANQVAGSRYISSFNLMYALIPGNSMFAQPTGESLLDGGAPFYNSYQCADGGWMSV